MNHREQLIEKAARILWAEDDSEMETSWLSNAALYRATAEKIAALFEETNTPTDDEREALEEALEYLDDLNADRQIWYDDYSKLHDLVSRALHRTVQGEPTCEHEWKNRVSGGSKCTKCDLWRDKRVPVQGEPSDADAALLAAANAYMHYAPPYDSLSAFSDIFLSDMRAALRAATEAAEQGEPSDADLQRAVDAFMRSWTNDPDGLTYLHKHMRAALRAAAATGGE